MALERDVEAGETDDFLLINPQRARQPEIPMKFHLPRLRDVDIFEITVDELQHLYSSEAFTAEEYTQFCLDRIQAVNPYLEAVIETNPDALATARYLDEERRSGRLRGVLHGVPVLVKDVGCLSL
jgi:amidase